MPRPRKAQPPPKRTNARRHGEGSIQQVGKRWRAFAPTDADGHRKSKRFDTKEDAEFWLAQILGGETPDVPAIGPEQPLADYLLAWLKGLTVSKTTRAYYGRAVRYAEPLWHTRMKDLTPRDFQALFAGWLQSSPARPKRTMQPNTARTLRRALSVALNAAVPDLLPANPIRKTKLPAVVRKDVPHWSADDANRFLRYAVDSPLYAFFRLALGIGARTGELRGLQWSDLDLAAGSVMIRRSLHPTTLEIHPTKTKREREVALPLPAIAALRRHRAAQTVVSEWVFCDNDGRPLKNEQVAQEFRRIRQLAGVPPMILYGTRHTWASGMLAAGEPLPEVSRTLGHSDPSITARVYWRYVKSDRKQIAKASAEVFP